MPVFFYYVLMRKARIGKVINKSCVLKECDTGRGWMGGEFDFPHFSNYKWLPLDQSQKSAVNHCLQCYNHLQFCQWKK